MSAASARKTTSTSAEGKMEDRYEDRYKEYFSQIEPATSSGKKNPFNRQLLQRTSKLAILSSAALCCALPTAVAQENENGRDVITVTATKRETNLLETPVAVSVVGENEINQRRLVGMEDYLAGLPGVTFSDRGAGSNTINIRGIGLGDQLDPNTPVGSYFGETPITGLGTRVNGNAAGNADIKMVDINRVEVLRGPQGTLYGTGSMGGTVRIIPNAPNLQEVEGKLAAQYSVTGENGGDNYMAQAVVNAPLIEDVLAVRMAAYRFENDGVVRNVAGSNPTPNILAVLDAGGFAEDQEHVGGDKYEGVRVSALWQPIDDFKATFSYLKQSIEQDGGKEVETTLPGRYETARVKIGNQGLGDEFIDSTVGIANLVLEYDLGWGSVLNSTSLINTEGRSDVDLTFLGASLTVSFLGTSSLNTKNDEIFVNEFRFVSDFEGPFQVLAGMYYEDREVYRDQEINWRGAPPGPETVFAIQSMNERTQRQIAGFGELEFTPFDPLTITFGARYFNFEQGIPLSVSGGVTLSDQGTLESTDGFNFKANVSYQVTDQLFAYAQWAQGFREPRIQGQVIPEFDADNDGLVEFADGIEREVQEGLLDPDEVDTYEAGIKFQLADNRITGSLTGFYTDWTGIPIVPSLTEFAGAALYFNAGEATSKGVEFETTAEPVEDLIFQVSTSWVETTLGADAAGLGTEGADLPGSADFNAHAALQKRFQVGGNDAFARGDYTYVGGYQTSFVAGEESGDYHLLDFSAGVTIDNVDLGVFVKNLTNADDFTWIDNIFFTGRAYRLRPRTIGVNASFSF